MTAMQKKRIFFGRTSLFHDHDLILCPYPVSQVLQLEDTVERQQRFISRLEEERDRCANISTKDLTETDKIDKNGKIENILTPDTWERALSRPRGLTACWKKEEMQRQSCSTQRNRFSLQKKELIAMFWLKLQVAEGKAELRKQQNLYHRSSIHST